MRKRFFVRSLSLHHRRVFRRPVRLFIKKRRRATERYASHTAFCGVRLSSRRQSALAVRNAVRCAELSPEASSRSFVAAARRPASSGIRALQGSRRCCRKPAPPFLRRSLAAPGPEAWRLNFPRRTAIARPAADPTKRPAPSGLPGCFRTLSVHSRWEAWMGVEPTTLRSQA